MRSFGRGIEFALEAIAEAGEPLLGRGESAGSSSSARTHRQPRLHRVIDAERPSAAAPSPYSAGSTQVGSRVVRLASADFADASQRHRVRRDVPQSREIRICRFWRSVA